MCCGMLQCEQRCVCFPISLLALLLRGEVQPIPLGVTFSNADPKLKARTSVFTETWQKRRSSFELKLSKMSPQVGLAVVSASAHVCQSVPTPYCIWSVAQSALGVFINLNLQSHSHWSLFKGA